MFLCRIYQKRVQIKIKPNKSLTPGFRKEFPICLKKFIKFKIYFESDRTFDLRKLEDWTELGDSDRALKWDGQTFRKNQFR